MFRTPGLVAMIASLVISVASAGTVVAAESEPMLKVTTDHARVLRMPRAAESVIIGNPAIVDVTVHDPQTLVLTGRSYGITNLVVLDREGEVIIDEKVIVTSFEVGTVRVYRQSERITYACSPECEPTVTIGDSELAFTAAAAQFGTRQGMATGAAQ